MNGFLPDFGYATHHNCDEQARDLSDQIVNDGILNIEGDIIQY